MAAVKAGDGTIGYADDSQAGDLGVASIKVGSDYTRRRPPAPPRSLAASPRTPGRDAVDMSIDVDRTTTAAGAYPLMLTSYLIACQTYPSKTDASLVKGFLSYAVSPEGQQAAAKQAGSAPLDPKLQQEAASIVSKISSK